MATIYLYLQDRQIQISNYHLKENFFFNFPQFLSDIKKWVKVTFRKNVLMNEGHSFFSVQMVIDSPNMMGKNISDRFINMNMFWNVPFLYAGIKKVLNPLPDCLTPLCHITDRAFAPDTDPHCGISFRKKKNSKQRRRQAEAEGAFSRLFWKKRQRLHLFFCQVCVLVEESVVFCLIDCLANNCREELECWPAGQQFFISAILKRKSGKKSWHPPQLTPSASS